MDPSKLKACLVGYGKMGRWHHEVASKLFRVVSVYDPKVTVQQDGILDATSLREAIEDVDAVIIASPAHTHFGICETCLSKKKHVFVDSSLSDRPSQVDRLYTLAKRHKCVLYIGLLKRMDPSWRKLSSQLMIEYPLFASVSCKEAEFPSASYFQVCGSIFRDLCIYDIDILCVILQDFPTKVFSRVDLSGETASITLCFSKGCIVRTLHSRHAKHYNESATITCRKKELALDSQNGHHGIRARFRKAAVSQMRDFKDRIVTNFVAPNVSMDHYLMLERILYACEVSAYANDFVSVVSPIEMRHLVEKKHYSAIQALKYQTVQHVRRMRTSVHPKHISLTVWEALSLLKSFEDVSHPLFSVYHYTFQLIDSLQSAFLPEWMQVTALLHRLGSVLSIWGSDEDGTTEATQWSLTGKTFLVGCPIPGKIDQSEYNTACLDTMDPMTTSSLQRLLSQTGIYKPHCGLDACLVSYSQDEYIHSVVQASNTSLPPEAFKILRYQSLNLWHTEDAYQEIECRDDILHKGWVKLFDTYVNTCKETIREVDYEQIRVSFAPIIEKYIRNSTLAF